MVTCEVDIGVGTRRRGADNSTRVPYLTVVQTECLDGFFLYFGNRERVCQADGTLSGHYAFCVDECKLKSLRVWGDTIPV